MKFPTMTTTDLSEQLSALQKDIVDIKAQLDHASANFRMTGTYADPDWFHRAKTALRHKNRLEQEMRQELSRRRKESRVGHHRTIERFFVEEAKRRLAHDEFLDIMGVARQLAEQEQRTMRGEDDEEEPAA